MVHSQVKKYRFLYVIALCTITKALPYEKQTLCFLSFLDAGEAILQDSCALIESDANDPTWMRSHDMLLGTLARLEYELEQLHMQRSQVNDIQDTPLVLVSDFEFLVTLLQKSEDMLKESTAISPVLLQTIVHAKRHLSALMYSND